MIDQVLLSSLYQAVLQSNKGTGPDSSYLFEQGEADDKIIAVCADDPEYKHFNDIKELPPHRLAEIRRFFEDCILVDPLILHTPSKRSTKRSLVILFFLEQDDLTFNIQYILKKTYWSSL
jgi:hypothetical protein